jgi:hypothetical protein
MNLTESLVLLAVSVGLLIFGRGRRAFLLSEITLGRGAAIRDNDIVSFRCGPHGHRGKSTLAKLRIACVTTRRFPPPWSVEEVGRLL